MSELDLNAIFTVLSNEGGEPDALQAVRTGVAVSAGEALAAVDAIGRRHLLVPLRDGEAFAEDRSSSGVQLVRADHGGDHYLAVVCNNHDLDDVFARFCKELLEILDGSPMAAKHAVDALARWRRLFADAQPDALGDTQLVGLLAELLVLEEIVARDPSRRVNIWTGPSKSQHDFRAGPSALEVKATTVREGRVVSISSIDQLVTPEGGSLHLVHYRFEHDPAGESLPGVVERIQELSVDHQDLLARLAANGYLPADADKYRTRTYSVVETRTYDVDSLAFPKIVPSSFKGGKQPAGTQRLSYAIDLVNEPPHPLSDRDVDSLLTRFALCP